MTRSTQHVTQRLCTCIGQHITRVWQSQYCLCTPPATSTALLSLSARRVCSARPPVHRTANTAVSTSLCSQSSFTLVKKHGTIISWHSLHVSPHNPTQRHAKHVQAQQPLSTATPCRLKKRRSAPDTATDDAVTLIPKEVTQRAKQLSKLMTQQQPKRSRDKLETKYSAQIRRKLKARFQGTVQDAASSPHWKANPAGFLACLKDIELLFRQLFAPLCSESAPDYCCSVAATTLSVSQCIDRILPVLLTQQGGTRNMVEVAEFLQDMMGMDGSQMFRCFVQEPSVLYLDVYSSLLPLQALFHTLHWDPADYNKIISRHPQILLLPLQQFQRSIGYLLGQGLSQAEILRMWGKRAGLLVQPLDRLHGEVLALRASNRPLQDLALPYHERASPIAQAQSRSFVPRSDLPRPPAKTGKVAAAISALVGSPQAAYLYQHNRDRLLSFQGVHQAIDGSFLAKAAVGKRNITVTLGRFPTMQAAARAYDAAVYKHYGFRRLFNFPDEYAHLKPLDAEAATIDKQELSKQKLALQQ